MKRRRFIQALAATPAAPALLAQQAQQGAQPIAQQVPPPAEASLRYTVPDAAAETVLHFFTAQQFAALRRLSDILNPPMNGAPGALEAKAPELLDFLLSQSRSEERRVGKEC